MMLRKSRERIRLMKIRRVALDIENTISNSESDYIVPMSKLCEARSSLGCDTKACLRTVNAASRLFLRESEIARRYNLISDRIKIVDDRELNELDARYHECIRAGDYRKAETLLRRIRSMKVLFKEFKTLKLSSEPGRDRILVIRNDSSEHISIDSIQLSGVGSGFSELKKNMELWPRQYLKVDLGRNDSERLHVVVNYYSKGSRHAELYEFSSGRL